MLRALKRPNKNQNPAQSLAHLFDTELETKTETATALASSSTDQEQRGQAPAPMCQTRITNNYGLIHSVREPKLDVDRKKRGVITSEIERRLVVLAGNLHMSDTLQIR